ncbi:6e3a6ce7-21c9-4797-866e-7e5234a8d787-CDS [Sclerotinia trifoliorum]|uniref:6e3a6ce7-21c9-4797-866e-7e5234a8d787-CDS n=1 Tax=Sclerotinia trifoliorum TaxID=28548 RepID=A0A8H2VT96_9HELO|nr:6e3a6ce7-21c9-4797-866e-7e5234a8d787-CDS [Sclerotinia trifoliorum]
MYFHCDTWLAMYVKKILRPSFQDSQYITIAITSACCLGTQAHTNQ